MLIKPFLCVLTKSEMHQIMCSGFATIAGSVLVAYQKLGVSGTALISSCTFCSTVLINWSLCTFAPVVLSTYTSCVIYIGVMSIPASIVVSKLRYPEEEETTSSEKLSLASVEDAREGAGNWMHSFTNGAWLGVRLAGIVVAVLACVIAGVDLVDAILTWAGSYLNIESLTLEVIFGYLFVPVAFFLGIPNRELVLVGRLIAVKFLKVSQTQHICNKSVHLADIYHHRTNSWPINNYNSAGTTTASPTAHASSPPMRSVALATSAHSVPKSG